MGAEIQDSLYRVALNDVIAHGEQLIQSLPQGDQARATALKHMTAAVEDLGIQTPSASTGSGQKFLDIAVQMRTGYLLVSAGTAAQTGNGTLVRDSLSSLNAESAVVGTGMPIVLLFEKDLLAPPDVNDGGDLLETFKHRATRTLDNMVSEASEVIGGAVKKIADKFEKFVSELGDLAKSFSIEGASGVIQEGLRKIANALNALGDLLKNDKLKDAINTLREMTKDLSVSKALSSAFHRDRTQKAIDALRPATSRTGRAMEEAEMHLAEMASRYVLLLNRARWIVGAIGVAGGLLTVTGVAAHYAVLGTPIAYAVVSLVVILIGYDFVASQLPRIVAGI